MRQYRYFEGAGGYVVSRREFLAGAAASALVAKMGHPTTAVPAEFWLGTSYYPDLTPRAEWATDFRRMRELGLETVRMAEFAWATMQPAEGRFEFGWLDEAIELAKEHGISVLLGVPTAGLPAWLHREHPDVLGGNERGPYTYGGRKGFSLHSAAMKLAAQRIIRTMGRRYALHPAVVGWQLSNEPGFPFTAYDAATQRAFRLWLKARYGTLAALNEAWGARFWSNTYDSWDEIELPLNQAEMGLKPAVRLEYRRFFSDSWLDWLRMESTTLRAVGVKQKVFANWPEATWSVDVYKTEPFLDATAWDNYGPIADDRDYHGQWYAAMNHDLCRCSRKDQRFFVSEQRSQATASGEPKAVRLQTMTDVAYGAFGTLYFEWRPPVSGAERGYVSILEKDGSLGASAGEIRRVRQEMDALWPRLKDAKTRSKIAMLFSFDNQWDRGFGQTDPEAKNLSYTGNFSRFYAGVKALQSNVDVVAPTALLDGYAMVVAPGLQMVSDELAARLRVFVERGGCLVLDQGSGTRDEAGHDRRMRGPGPFQDMAGLRVVATSRVDGAVPGYFVQFKGESQHYAALRDMERVELRGAEEIALLLRPRETDLPAVTVNRFGKGKVVYFAAGSSEVQLYEDAMQQAGKLAGITPLLAAPAGVDVVSRVAEDGREYVFAMNMTPEAHNVAVSGVDRDAITNEPFGDSLVMEPFDVRVILRGS